MRRLFPSFRARDFGAFLRGFLQIRASLPPFHLSQMAFPSYLSPLVRRSFGAGKSHPKQTETKAEAAALAWLSGEGWQVIPQPCRLFPLAGGGSYTPDLLAWRNGFPGVLVVEVKGGYRGAGWEQGYERYKRAADAFDCHAWRFCLAEVKKGGAIDVAFWSAGADVLALSADPAEEERA